MSNQRQTDGAIWKRTINTKNGQLEVLSVVIGDKRFTAWPNTFKQEGEKSPDYRLTVDNYEKKATNTAPAARKTFAGQTNDLPF